MDSGIEFGKVEIREPEPELRPDRNRKYAVVNCGISTDGDNVNEFDGDQQNRVRIDDKEIEDLPIFVDLDVMRDMEGHARTNTHVELGGVLLGGKYIDENGQSFVVIHEALRAEHYEATRGSFKFTHETWAQITRDREQFPEDLHLVGWYHTHPDWGVFLSGMDMFICDNFFNDTLDVALVIDPCRGDRGWFYWDHVNGKQQKRRASSFYLFANRYRRTELLKFAEALGVTNPAYFDPRYEAPMGEMAMQPSSVHIHDQKSPALMIAVLGMLTIQMLMMSLIAWRMLAPASNDVAEYDLQRRNQVYREILGQMVNSPDGPKLVDQLEQMVSANASMATDLDGRAALIDNLKDEKFSIEKQMEKVNEDLVETEASAKRKDNDINQLKKQLKGEAELNADIKKGKSIGGFKWPIVGGIALLTALAGLFGGTLLGRRFNDDDEFYEPNPRSKDSTSTISTTGSTRKDSSSDSSDINTEELKITDDFAGPGSNI